MYFWTKIRFDSGACTYLSLEPLWLLWSLFGSLCVMSANTTETWKLLLCKCTLKILGKMFLLHPSFVMPQAPAYMILTSWSMWFQGIWLCCPFPASQLCGLCSLDSSKNQNWHGFSIKKSICCVQSVSWIERDVFSKWHGIFSFDRCTQHSLYK